jgi:hypothetical protein
MTDERRAIQLKEKKFTEEELEKNDFKAYLASESSDDSEGEAADTGEPAFIIEMPEGVEEEEDNNKEKAKFKLKALLDEIKPTEEQREDMEITFTPGLSEAASNLLSKKKEAEVLENKMIDRYRSNKMRLCLKLPEERPRRGKNSTKRRGRKLQLRMKMR